eukprot:CAMPEP_0113472766 /NCGR_PEP_ID=MMETSP0014_2-20120614/17690_1 /TAXON_ID=2857 /ORGANISM="Nitzschia sp." /LENGTH=870 /DNA_ID=CAMNT_0000365497 /DNA_START=295 /DNA_END=2904 /DNA_ORIENTATION=- /assembly_acc=CAM_ASM_000159
MSSVGSSSTMILPRSGAYEAYKSKTRSFRDGLEKLRRRLVAPSSKKHTGGRKLVTVADLSTAVDDVYGRFVVDETSSTTFDDDDRKNTQTTIQGLVDDLNVTISLRVSVGATYEHDENDGHYYMIQILRYCRRQLKACIKALAASVLPAQQRNDSRAGESDGSMNNRFLFLDIQDDEGVVVDDDDDDIVDNYEQFEEYWRNTSKECTIEEDLIKGSLAFEANLFFLTAERYFALVDNEYQQLHQALSDRSTTHTEKAISLIQATSAINLVLENVCRLEKTLQLECDKLNSIYTFLAVLIFNKQIADMERILGEESLTVDPDFCLNYCSMCVQLGFHGIVLYHQLGYCKKILDQRVEFKRIPICGKKLSRIFEIGLQICVTAEMAGQLNYIRDSVDEKEGVKMVKEPVFEVNLPRKEDDGTIVYKKVTTATVNWFHAYPLLGGKPGIMTTFYNMEVLHPQKRKAVEQARQKITEAISLSDPDDAEIMFKIWSVRLHPFLDAMHQQGVYEDFCGSPSRKNEVERCMVFHRIYGESCPKRDPDDPGFVQTAGASFSSVFAVHSLLHGIKILRDETKRAKVLSRLAFQRFKSQMSAFQSKRAVNLEARPSILSHYRSASPIFQNENHDPCQAQAVWNPLMAGNLLSLVTYIWNTRWVLDNGHSSSRTLLYFYHSLRQHRMIEMIDVLESLSRIQNFSDHSLKTFLVESGFRQNDANALSEVILRTGLDQTTDARKTFRLKETIRNFPDSIAISVVRLDQFLSVISKDKDGLALRVKIVKIRYYMSSYRCILENAPIVDDSDGSGGSIDDVVHSCERETAALKKKIGDDAEALRFNWHLVADRMDECHDLILEALQIPELVETYHDIVYSDLADW